MAEREWRKEFGIPPLAVSDPRADQTPTPGRWQAILKEREVHIESQLARSSGWNGQMWRCKACGVEFKSLWQFCPNCGERSGFDLFALIDSFKVGIRIAVCIVVFFLVAKFSEGAASLIALAGAFWIWVGIAASYKRWRMRRNPTESFRAEHPNLYPSSDSMPVPAQHGTEAEARLTQSEVERLQSEVERLKNEISANQKRQAFQDAKLLEVIKRCQPTIQGAFAADVEGYFVACGIPETRVGQIIESAIARNIITRKTAPMYFEGGTPPEAGQS